MECNCEKAETGECNWLRHPHFIDGEYIEDCKLDEYRDASMNRRDEIQCSFCGLKFYQTEPNQEYCSEECLYDDVLLVN
jgi:hypothetical protein